MKNKTLRTKFSTKSFYSLIITLFFLFSFHDLFSQSIQRVSPTRDSSFCGDRYTTFSFSISNLSLIDSVELEISDNNGNFSNLIDYTLPKAGFFSVAVLLNSPGDYYMRARGRKYGTSPLVGPWTTSFKVTTKALPASPIAAYSKAYSLCIGDTFLLKSPFSGFTKGSTFKI